MSTSPDQVLSRLAELLREVISDGWADDVAITRETSFNRDLELESIEFVALAEKVQENWGARVDFAGWLADKDLDAIIALNVGEVADFICSCLSSTEAA